MPAKKKKKLLEAILFLENMPVTIEEISKFTKLDKNECVLLAEELMEEFNKKTHGICIIKIAGGYQMVPSEELKDELVEIYADRKKSRLSRATLETLAIIAWKQPCTRAEVENIRGVDCSNAIKILAAKELIEEKGRKEVIGRPILYGTTKEFLRYFGLRNLDELPPLEEIKNVMFRPIKTGEAKDYEEKLEQENGNNQVNGEMSLFDNKNQQN